METEDVTVESVPATYTWVVWRDRPAGIGEVNRHVMELMGSLESSSEWRAWEWRDEQEALETLCRLGDGAGEYMLICGDRIERVAIVAETVYRRAY